MVINLDISDVKQVTSMIIDHFKSNEDKINNLNVFPVPDGDTGTNMLLTLQSINKEISDLNQNDFKSLVEAISFGGLMGARGNSGVILSQMLKGFFDALTEKGTFDLKVLEEALNSAKNLAYSSVQNPTEGTMLTMIKDLYFYIKNFNENNAEDVPLSKIIDNLICEAEKSLARTTFLLPVLKEANVVDAGAMGLLEILKGFKKAVEEVNRINRSLKAKELVGVKSYSQEGSLNLNQNLDYLEAKIDDDPAEKELGDLNIPPSATDIKNIYCTEFVLTGEKMNLMKLREDIENLGDSTMVVGDDSLIKVHVHSNYPHKVIARAIKEGTLHEIQINNMVDQYNEKMKATSEISSPSKQTTYGLITVSNGDGLDLIFKSLGVDVVIKGGQTMNPSTYELVKAIKKLDVDKIIILPNNKNIILTARQAAKISKKDVTIIPTETIPQGINAILNFNRDLTLEENLRDMEEAYHRIKTGEITVAVRDANLFIGKIKKGDFIGLFDGRVKVVSEDLTSAVIELIESMVDENNFLISFYKGKDVADDQNDILRKEIAKKFPNLEVEFYDGGQPFYHYIFSIE